MFGTLALLLAQAAAPAASDEIVVLGNRAEKALAECLARNCPPEAEVEMSLEASVEQFADGRYADARRTLRKALSRNKNHAATMPGPISSLYATLATVAEHEGDTRLWRSAAWQNVEILRRYVGPDNLATLKEELSFADAMIGLGSPDTADHVYQNVESKARASGQDRLAAGATFRRAWLALLRQREDDAERLADEAVAAAGPNDPLMTQLRAILLTRIAVRRGDTQAVDALASSLRQSAKETPRLLFAPPVEDINGSDPGDSIHTSQRYDSQVRFGDIGYWIRPDGRTQDVEILRDSGLGQWQPGILRQIRARRYAPLDVEPGHPGLYRIDRFTIRGEVGQEIGSRIPRNTGRPTLHVIDLTETDAMADARNAQSGEAPAAPMH